MSTYGKKRTALLKNQKSLKYEIRNNQTKLENKYKPLVKAYEEETANGTIDLEKFYEDVKKITNVIASDRPKVLSSEYKAIHYIQQSDKFKAKEIVPKELTGLDKLYDQLSQSLFKSIISGKYQTPEELQEKTIEQLSTINYSMNVTKSY